MKYWKERPPIYAALILLSSICGVFLGPGAGALSFLQMAIVIELTYVIGGVVRNQTNHSQGPSQIF